VPFGRYKAPYFPRKELYYFAEKAARATFMCEPYENIFHQASKNSVIYCDPPYAPISKTANFSNYSKNGFNLENQTQLAEIAYKTASQKEIPVLISNHDTSFTRKIYKQAKLSKLQVNRFISQSGGTRNKVSELLALYAGSQ
jgi:DNA adenine methylase